jgi:hypothetical protein
MNITQWIKYGVDNGFCTPSYCDTHDGMPLTAEEENLWEVGEDPCAHAVRLIESPEMAKNLAENTNH